MKPVFPVEPKHGQQAFFAHVGSPGTISYYGIVTRRQMARWLVQLLNSSSGLTFDPQTGYAKPWGHELQLVWLADAGTVPGKGYNEIMANAQALLTADRRERAQVALDAERKAYYLSSRPKSVNSGIATGGHMEYAVKLGNKVQDMSSGLIGFATARVHRLHGAVQFTIQPYNDSGTKIEDCFNIDEGWLVVKEPGLVDKAQPEQVPAFSLGSMVRDTVSGIEGIAVAYHVYFNGCLMYAIERPASSTKDKSLKYEERVVYAHQGQMLLVLDAVVKPVKTGVGERTGGPTDRVPATRAHRA